MTTDVTDVIAQAIATAQADKEDIKAAAIAAAEAFAAGEDTYREKATRQSSEVKQPVP